METLESAVGLVDTELASRGRGFREGCAVVTRQEQVCRKYQSVLASAPLQERARIACSCATWLRALLPYAGRSLPDVATLAWEALKAAAEPELGWRHLAFVVEESIPYEQEIADFNVGDVFVGNAMAALVYACEYFASEDDEDLGAVIFQVADAIESSYQFTSPQWVDEDAIDYEEVFDAIWNSASEQTLRVHAEQWRDTHFA